MVSVIIPVYNDAAWLDRAVKSALAQRAEGGIEIILIDNNSTDGSLKLCHDFRARFPDVIVVGNAVRQGAAAARNEGLRLARGEWINFLDADDIFLPGKIARQLALVEDDTDWVIQAYYDQAIGGERVLSGLNEDPWKGLVYNGGLGSTNSQLIRKRILENVGGQDEDLPNGEDTDMYFRLLKAGPAIKADLVPGSVYLDRSGPRLSQRSGSESLRRRVFLHARVNDWLSQYQPAYFEENDNFFRAALLNAIRQLATENLKEGITQFNNHFPSGVSVSDLDFTIVPRLAMLYSILGFAPVETARSLMKKYMLVLIRQNKGTHD